MASPVVKTESTIVLSRVLKKGATGDDVLAVQKRLAELGYLTATPDGIFGAKTEAAVCDFQLTNGLGYSDGFVGLWTMGKLNGNPVEKTGSTQDRIIPFSELQVIDALNRLYNAMNYGIPVTKVNTVTSNVTRNAVYNAAKAIVPGLCSINDMEIVEAVGCDSISELRVQWNKYFTDNFISQNISSTVPQETTLCVCEYNGKLYAVRANLAKWKYHYEGGYYDEYFGEYHICCSKVSGTNSYDTRYICKLQNGYLQADRREDA